MCVEKFELVVRDVFFSTQMVINPPQLYFFCFYEKWIESGWNIVMVDSNEETLVLFIIICIVLHPAFGKSHDVYERCVGQHLCALHVPTYL